MWNKRSLLVICLYLAGCGKDKQPVHIVENSNPERSGEYAAATNSPVDYDSFGKKNIFGLKEEPEDEPVPPPTVVPHLAGISMLRNNTRAVLRIDPPKGGPAEYKFIEVGERIWGVEVLMIDPERGVVEVKAKGKTYSLKLDKCYTGQFSPSNRGT